MVERELGGMEERAPETERRAPSSVRAVADQRVTDGGEVHADLVGATRLQPTLEASELGGRAVAPSHLVLGARRAPVDDDRHPHRVGGVAPDRGVDDAVRRVRVIPTPSRRSAARPCGRRTGRSATMPPRSVRATTSSPELPASRRWTMPGRSGSPTAGEIREVVEESVHERALLVAGAGVDDQPGRLVDHDDRVVDVDDPEHHVRVRLGRTAPRDRGRIDDRPRIPR